MNRVRQVVVAILTVLAACGVVVDTRAQVVSTEPAFPRLDEPVTITFRATEGNGGLASEQGTVYIHTGVITDRSAVKDGCGPNAATWRYVKTNWGQNTAQTAMTRVAPGVYQITIPDIRAYYGVQASESILRLAMVFRNASGSTTGKATGDCDIFVDVFQGGIQVGLVSPEPPAHDALVLLEPGSVDLLATTAAEVGRVDRIRLVIDGAETLVVEDDTLSFTWSIAAPGRYMARIVAEQGALTSETTLYVVLVEPVEDAPLPDGVRDGITYHDSPDRVTLSVYAPWKQVVHVIGDMNDWQVDAAYQMKRHAIRPDSVHWWITLDGLLPGVEVAYQYLLDGDLRIADPYTEKVVSPEDALIPETIYPDLKPYPSEHTSHAVSTFRTGATPYDWQVTDFARPPQGELVIYELLVRDFLSQHDWSTLADTLGYLERLGVNAIELMPVNEFEGNSSWGYNPSFFFAPDKYYGPAEDLKRFVDAAHARGIAVILDIVLNHHFGQSPMVRQYQDASGVPTAENPWFNQTCAHPQEGLCYGQDMNHESPETKAWVDRVLAHWLTEYRVDGFRFDLTKGLTNNNSGANYDADRIAIITRMLDRMWAVEPGAYAILEHWTGPTEERVLAEYGAMVWTNVNNAFLQATMGYLSSSDFRPMYFGRRGWTLPHVVSYMESHDEERLMVKALAFGNFAGSYDVKEPATALVRMQAAAAHLLLTPGPRMIWQFGELGYDVSINENERTGEKPVRWDYYADPDRRRLYEAYADFIRLRKAHEVFHAPETDVTQELAGMVRTATLVHGASGEEAVLVANFDVVPRTVTVSLPSAGTWYDVFAGTNATLAVPSETWDLAPGTFRLVMNVPPAVSVDREASGAQPPDAFALHANWPNPFSRGTTITYSMPAAGRVTVDVWTATGRRVAVLFDAWQTGGTHAVRFQPDRLAAGTYFYRVTTPSGAATRPMVVIP